MNVAMDGKSTSNKAVMRQSQAYPRELGKAIVSAWLTTRVSQASSEFIVGIQGHAGLNANDPDFDTAWEGKEVASIGPVTPDRRSDYDSCWGLATTQHTTLPTGRAGIRGGPRCH